MMTTMPRRLSIGLGFLLAVGCATTRVDLDETSAVNHRREAAKEEAVAQQYDAQHDRITAAEHREHATAHVDAANTLEAFEASECTDITPSMRASCPLL